MKKTLISVLVWLMLLGVPHAQSTTITHTTADGKVTFEHPATWRVLDDGSGLLFVASQSSLLGMDGLRFVEGEISLLLGYQDSELSSVLFGDFDLSPNRTLDEVAREILSFVADNPNVEERRLGDAVFYAAVSTFEEGAPTYYMTRTPSAGVILVLAYQGISDTSLLDALLASLATPTSASGETTDTSATATEIPFILPEVTRRTTPAPETCDNMLIAEVAPLPLREVELREIPFALALPNANARALYRFSNGTEHEAVLTYHEEAEVVTVSVPLFEASPYSPADVTLHIEDYNGEVLCPPQRMTILGLPRGNDTLQQTVAQIGEILAKQREALGVTVDELRPESSVVLSIEQYALAMAQYAYDDPSNPNALIRLADGSAPLLQDDEIDMDLLNSLLASTLLSDFVAQQAQRKLPALRTADWRDPSRHLASTYLIAQSRLDAALKKDIPNFKTLAEYMEQQYSAQHFIGNADSYAGKTFNDIALVNSLGSRVTGIYGVIIGAVMYTAKIVYEADLNLLPHKITRVELDYNDDIDYEDDENTYNYRNMRVTAESRGWNVKYTLIDGVLMIGGQRLPLQAEKNAAAGAQKVLDFSQNPQARAAAEQALQRSNSVIATFENTQVASEVSSNLISRTDSGGSIIDEVLTIAPFVWENIPVDYEDIREVRVIAPPTMATPAIKITDEARGEYRAWNAGRSLIRFELKVENQAIFLHKPITVYKIELTWNAPTTIVIQEGEEYCFDARISNALDRRTRILVEGEGASVTLNYDDFAPQYCFKAPPNIRTQWTEPLFCDLEPVLMPEFYTVEIESLADKGARDQAWNPSWEARRLVSVVRVEPSEATQQSAEKPDNPNCTAFAGDWEFTAVPADSFFCVPYEIPLITSSVNMNPAGGGRNLLDADVVVVTGLDAGILTLAREDRNTRAFFAEDNSTFEELTMLMEWQLTFEDAQTATLIVKSYTNIFDQLPEDARPLVNPCRTGNITYFIVYKGKYVGGR